MSEAGGPGGCPVCSEPADFPDLATGDIFDCSSCGTALEVLDVGPLQLAVAEEVEEEEASEEAEFDEFEDGDDGDGGDDDEDFDDDDEIEDD